MAYLVGQQGSGWTIDSAFPGDYPVQIYLIAGYTVSVAGTATTAYINVNSWSSNNDCKVVVYDSSRAKLGESTGFTASQGIGLISQPITLSRALVLSEMLLLTLATEDYFMEPGANSAAGTASMSRLQSITYGSLPSTLPADSAYAMKEFVIWLDGTVGGATILPQIMQHEQ
jgi:hypothetical protein